MLAITEDAAAAIKGIVGARRDCRTGAGLRITQELNTETEERREPTSACPWSSPRRRATRCSSGEPDLRRARDAAEFLDDKLLDADVVDEEVRFSLDVQAETL